MVYCCAYIVLVRPAVATTSINNVAGAAINITTRLNFVPKVEPCNRLVVYNHSDILEKSDEKFIQNSRSIVSSKSSRKLQKNSKILLSSNIKVRKKQIRIVLHVIFMLFPGRDYSSLIS